MSTEAAIPQSPLEAPRKDVRDASMTATQILRMVRAQRISEGRNPVPASRLEDLKIDPVIPRSAEEMKVLANRYPELVTG